MPRVAVEIAGPVARVWLDRAEARNAFDGAMVVELTTAISGLGTQAGLRAIVLGGRGPVFCAGADIEWMRSMAGATREANLREARALAGLFAAVAESPLPVVLRAHGAALGGGSGLAAACDIAIAAEGTVFGFTETRLGIVPAVISPFVLPKIGVSAARELFLTGERFDAAKALAIGLVRAVVPAAELDATVDARVGELLKAGPQAIAEAKRLIRDVAFRSAESVRELTIELIANRRVTAEGQEGLSAFLEKRKPDWIA
jgi:methylglutaconyl-CoA hydratase